MDFVGQITLWEKATVLQLVWARWVHFTVAAKAALGFFEEARIPVSGKRVSTQEGELPILSRTR